MINKTSLLYTQMLLLSLPTSSVFVSKVLHALAPIDLLPVKAPGLEKKGRKGRAEVKLFVELTHTNASTTGTVLGQEVQPCPCSTPTMNHSGKIQNIKCGLRAQSTNTSLHSKGQKSGWTIALYLYPAFSWICKFCILESSNDTFQRTEEPLNSHFRLKTMVITFTVQAIKMSVSAEIQLCPRHTQDDPCGQLCTLLSPI